MMSEEIIEAMVEEIMRQYHMGSYKEYNDESLREYYRTLLKEREKEKNACC